MTWTPWHFIVVAVAGWMNRQQQDAIAYLQEENRILRKLVLQMAEQNPSWGCGHIHGELKGLGYHVSWQTVRRVMLDHGLLPDPDNP